MRTIIAGLALAFFGSLATPAAAGQFTPGRELKLSFNPDGTVDLVARNVTTRDILMEWARQCQCHVVNAEQVVGGAIMLPLLFEDARQSDVLQSLLKSAAGYVLTPQRPGARSASNYETIYILATSNPTAGGFVPPPPASAAVPPPTVGSPEDELPPVLPVPTLPARPAAAPGAAPPAPPAAPANPFGSRTSSPFGSVTPAPPAAQPGTTTPVAPAPQQPVAPARPGTAVPIVAAPASGQ